MHSFVTSKNAQWRRLIWPTLYICSPLAIAMWNVLNCMMVWLYCSCCDNTMQCC